MKATRLMWIPALVAASWLAGAPSAWAGVPGHVAGYSEVASSNPTQTAATTIVVPRIACTGVPPRGFQEVFAGVRIDTASGVTTAGVNLECAPRPLYRAVMEVNGTFVPVDLSVLAGDTVRASASESATATEVTLVDGGETQTGTGPGASVTAEDIGDIAVNCTGPPCTPVPHLRVTNYSASTIDGLSLTGASQGDIVDAASATEMKSTLLHSGGHAFSVRWVSSCATSGVC